MTYILNERLKDFENNVDRALTGFLFNKNNDNIERSDVEEVKKIINKIFRFEDYMEITNIMDDWVPGNEKNILNRLKDIFSKYNIDLENHMKRKINEEDNVKIIKEVSPTTGNLDLIDNGYYYFVEKQKDIVRDKNIENILEYMDISYMETLDRIYFNSNISPKTKRKLREKIQNVLRV